jgi:sugar O-acyltransferase (sialic acid O-acetyltransferase NeuD family)
MSGREVIIWGATGHSRVLRECLHHTEDHLVALFDSQEGLSSPFADIPLVGGIEAFKAWRADHRGDVHFLLAIGGNRGSDRLRLAHLLTSAGLRPMTVVHPTAFVAHNAGLDQGCQVLAGAIVCVEARVGQQTIVNTRASLDHETVLGRGVHVGPGATLAGCVEVEDCAFIGAGAVVLPRLRIGERALVGAGSVVTRDIPPGAVAYGNPARVHRLLEEAA